MAHVSVFIDPPAGFPPEVQKLFDDFGLEAWGIIACMQENEQQREEPDPWDLYSPNRGGPEREESYLDFGPAEDGDEEGVIYAPRDD